jgi:membrane protease YdiL (CAAX protease family)
MTTSPSPKDSSPSVTDPDATAARAADPTATRGGADVAPGDRRAVVAREKERYGGIKWGSAFFGWLTATGTAVLLTALLLAAGATVGIANGTAAADARDNAATIGLAGGLTLLAVLLVAYFCGGYVAGRMARFSGAKQGIAVWIWAVVIAVAVAVAGAVLGDRYDLLDRIGGFPRLPIGGDNVTTGSIVAIAIALIAALAGAVLGGLAGMRYHRRVDEAGLGRRHSRWGVTPHRHEPVRTAAGRR